SSPSVASAQNAVPTAFAYTGVLSDDGVAIETDGEATPYDLEFRIFDHPDPNQARQVGPVVTRDGLAVTDGRVQTELDFGAAIFELPRRYLEIRFRPSGEAADSDDTWRVMRSLLQLSASVPQEETLPPPESDADLLRRLEIARVVISDREEPGKPHFRVDERSFRRAYGVASPVTATDVASVAMVAASELRRQAVRSRERIEALETEVSVLRFRSNLAFLLLAAMVVSVLLSRARKSSDETSGASEADAPSDASSESEAAGETSSDD
ncbi:MAG: hypothetical protein AAGE94_24825, partial [Acidobacteriota bacterium]